MKFEFGKYSENVDQEISVQIENHDTWNMDYTLSHIIQPMLVQLKKSKHGAPNVDMEDVPENLRASDEEVKEYGLSGDVDPLFFDRWDWIMDEMIWAFNEIRTNSPKEYMLDGDEWKKYTERKQHAFILFGKYFEALWD